MKKPPIAPGTMFFTIKGYKSHLYEKVILLAVEKMGINRQTVIRTPYKEKNKWSLHVSRMSSQGINLEEVKANCILLTIPAFASLGDVFFAYSFFDAVRQLCPHSQILRNGDDGYTLFQEKNYQSLWTTHLEITASYILDQYLPIEKLDGTNAFFDTEDEAFTLQVQGVNHPFHFSPAAIRKEIPGKKDTEIAVELIRRMIEVQWNYEYAYKSAYYEFENHPGEIGSIRIVTNLHSFFVRASNFIQMICGADIKYVQRRDFIDYAKRYNAITMVDSEQFVTNVIGTLEWEHLFKEVPGKLYVDKFQKRIHILYMNPGRNLTMSQYKDIKRRFPYPDAFSSMWMTKSKAIQKGDAFVVVQPNAPKAGVLFLGEFNSELRESQDDFGFSIAEYEALIAPDTEKLPLISMEKLQESMPWNDWENGEDMLLPAEDSSILCTLLTSSRASL